ncbi:hypothetical protein ACLX1H_004510 [Fusarium chlamydosporum]
MRLIEARKLIESRYISFKEFYGDLPAYAILSHTWESDQEVTFQECNKRRAMAKTGYKKIIKTCELALGDGLEYVWVDTCCIDKSSSAELTEAINSMYRWYEKATICYVYLIDKLGEKPLSDCRWFTRGWTLQELIAPATMTFFDSSWISIGTKHDHMDRLSAITSIDVKILNHKAPVSSACIAKRFSWAANRKTTRAEDMAYCMLGVCNINMPLLYGEGDNAFRRLQEEIIKSTRDFSLLAWTPPDNVEGEYCGFLAHSVEYFAACSDVSSIADPLLGEGELSMSNKGLKVKAGLNEIEWAGFKGSGASYSRYGLDLECTSAKYGTKYETKDGMTYGMKELAVPMRKVGPNIFVRARINEGFGYMDGPEVSFKMRRSATFRLRPLFPSTEFGTVTLLTTVPQPTVLPSLLQSLPFDIVAYSRYTVVEIIYPEDEILLEAYRYNGRVMPDKFWDLEDQAFFGLHGSAQNWGAFTPYKGVVFSCFWFNSPTGWRCEGTLLDLSDQKVTVWWKEVCAAAEGTGYTEPVTRQRLGLSPMDMRTSIVAQVDGCKVNLSFELYRDDDPNICRGPRWRIILKKDIIQESQE